MILNSSKKGRNNLFEVFLREYPSYNFWFLRDFEWPSTTRHYYHSDTTVLGNPKDNRILYICVEKIEDSDRDILFISFIKPVSHFLLPFQVRII